MADTLTSVSAKNEQYVRCGIDVVHILQLELHVYIYIPSNDSIKAFKDINHELSPAVQIFMLNIAACMVLLSLQETDIYKCPRLRVDVTLKGTKVEHSFYMFIDSYF